MCQFRLENAGRGADAYCQGLGDDEEEHKELRDHGPGSYVANSGLSGWKRGLGMRNEEEEGEEVTFCSQRRQRLRAASGFPRERDSETLPVHRGQGEHAVSSTGDSQVHLPRPRATLLDGDSEATLPPAYRRLLTLGGKISALPELINKSTCII